MGTIQAILYPPGDYQEIQCQQLLLSMNRLAAVWVRGRSLVLPCENQDLHDFTESSLRGSINPFPLDCPKTNINQNYPIPSCSVDSESSVGRASARRSKLYGKAEGSHQ